jgi:hypothetical protein
LKEKINSFVVMKYFYLALLIFAASCKAPVDNFRKITELDGQWQFARDTANIGIQQKWFLSEFSDSIALPGTTDLSQKGFLNKDTTTLHLNRLYKYEGVAWYRRKVIIPENYSNKHIQLFLERTKSSTVWVDSFLIGSSKLLQTPQVFDVSNYMTPGEHSITIRIDNDLKLTPYGNVHIYSDDTQTNWNGIIGKIFLEVSPKTYITNLQVYPDVENKKIKIKIGIENQLNFEKVDVELSVTRSLKGKTSRLKSSEFNLPCNPELIMEYELGNKCSLWDEYERALYNLTVTISNGDVKDSKTVCFGMRNFSVTGTQFSINGRTLFLRGKHDAAVFPLTGHTPMHVDDWIKLFRTAKSYGINHYRFHSYCPPEAAFSAADMEGIYLQAELPFWGGLESDTIAAMLLNEGIAMLDAYANHPSFVLFSHGNEIWSGHDRVEKNIIALKEHDNRILYTMGSNNNIGYVMPRACSDFFVGARTPYSQDTILSHTRLTQAFVDSRDGGILNTQIPSTEINYAYAVSSMKMPVISHEVGQYQIFPDYSEIGKYTGVLKAWNLEVFQKRLQKAGMSDMDSAFHKASGAWSAICYKAEMETAIRTNGLAGFQLLDLQDFPGQGTALVGILDAFMDSKNVISCDEWMQSCNDVVLLLEFRKYCWSADETFHARALVANYSNLNLKKNFNWEIKDEKGHTIRHGSFTNAIINCGGITRLGEIVIKLSEIKKAEKLTLYVSLPGTAYKNAYPVWVYPVISKIEIPDEIQVSEKLDSKTLTQLKKGGKVLFFPKVPDIANNGIPGLFPPEFWNYGMFKGISEWAKKPVSPGTLGLLTNPDHPIFNSFPTDFHTNWQWFSIIKASNSFILDDLSDDYRPIVLVVDNLERNHLLGLIFEFKVGSGKLLVCMSQLPLLFDKPEAVQLYKSLINYMISDEFNPLYQINEIGLMDLFNAIP